MACSPRGILDGDIATYRALRRYAVHLGNERLLRSGRLDRNNAPSQSSQHRHGDLSASLCRRATLPVQRLGEYCSNHLRTWPNSYHSINTSWKEPKTHSVAFQQCGSTVHGPCPMGLGGMQVSAQFEVLESKLKGLSESQLLSNPLLIQRSNQILQTSPRLATRGHGSP